MTKLKELNKEEINLLEKMKREVLENKVDYTGFEVAVSIFERNGKNVNNYRQVIDKKNIEKTYNPEKRLGIVRNVFMR